MIDILNLMDRLQTRIEYHEFDNALSARTAAPAPHPDAAEPATAAAPGARRSLLAAYAAAPAAEPLDAEPARKTPLALVFAQLEARGRAG